MVMLLVVTVVVDVVSDTTTCATTTKIAVKVGHLAWNECVSHELIGGVVVKRAVGVVCLLGLVWFGGPVLAGVPRGVVREHFGRGEWRLDVARDRFSGSVACRLRGRGGRQVYRAGAVGFAVGARALARA